MKREVITQEELKHVYASAQKRCEAHPELAKEYIELVEKQPFYNEIEDAIREASSASEKENRDGQVWAKVGNDGKNYYIQNYYIASADWRVLIAAEYIGMEQIYTTE